MESARFAGQLAARLPREGLLCSPCRRVEPPFARAVAYGVYEDKLREMVHLLKYEGMRSLAEPLGGFLAEAVIQLGGSWQETGGEVMVVAVPLFPANERREDTTSRCCWRRRRSAGCGGCGRSGGCGRDRRAAAGEGDQESVTLSAKGRRRNLVGAFAVADAAAVIGREVLVIDDIYTTGATARACARALQRAGARRVWVATLARAQQESVELWDADGRRLTA